MKKLAVVAMCLCVVLCCGTALGEGVSWADLLQDLSAAALAPSAENLAKIDADLQGMDSALAEQIAGYWKQVWLDPDYRLYLHGRDDPKELPVSGKHAFVVLGYQLKDGEMADELIGRCDAAAAAAGAFPDSILVCTGGATGQNNPDRHTEAGMMKAYLTEKRGISPDRIIIDESAMTTADNARNTLAILMEQGVETITIITSDYHQRRGMTLFYALALLYGEQQGYSVRIAGNYCWPAEADEKTLRSEPGITVFQLYGILGLSGAQSGGAAGK